MLLEQIRPWGFAPPPHKPLKRLDLNFIGGYAAGEGDGLSLSGVIFVKNAPDIVCIGCVNIFFTIVFVFSL
jgi:hypothetical protein